MSELTEIGIVVVVIFIGVLWTAIKVHYLAEDVAHIRERIDRAFQ